MHHLKLAPVAAVLVALLVSACGAPKTEDASAVLDVPSIDGSIAEFVDRGGPFDDVVIRLAVMADGQVAWFQGTDTAPEVFVKYVASLGTGMTGNIRAFSAEAALTQADDTDALRRRPMGTIACSGQEAQRSLILRRSGGHSTLAIFKACIEHWNPSLLHDEGHATDLGREADYLFDLLQGMRQVGARR